MTAVASSSADPLAPAALGAHAATLLQRDSWSREQLADYQRERLRGLVRHAVEHSPYYRATLGPGAERAELSALPTLPKRVLMEQFDRIVTDRRLHLAQRAVEARVHRRAQREHLDVGAAGLAAEQLGDDEGLGEAGVHLQHVADAVGTVSRHGVTPPEER